MAKHKIRVGITMGDPSGIGPAIVAKALPRLRGLAHFLVIGDAWVFNKVTGHRSQVTGFRFIDLKNVNRKHFEFGKVRLEYGKASMEYLDKALELLRDKEIDCLVTCPISKEAIHKAGFTYSGHTEYFAKVCGCEDLVMMLLNRHLRFSLVTRHTSLASVSRKLNNKNLRKTILMTYDALKKLFSLKTPRLVVCGLNPHASDNGLLGQEENRIIKPCLQKLKNKIRDLEGPLSSDVAIGRAFRGDYDAVIAMYHDQALIPLKLTGQDSGVNLTLGLPFVRTSPLHGTAFDIAKDFHLADPRSLMEAIQLSVRCTSNLKKA
jgi:4-hydroxythreonine-4-phosphate dehydrogenase